MPPVSVMVWLKQAVGWGVVRASTYAATSGLAPKIAALNGKQVPTLRVHNSGNTHGRMGGFLTGTDAKGISYDFTPSDFPILPHEEREVFLTPSTATDDHPTLTFPVTVKGTLEWGEHRTELNQRFE